MLRDGIGHYGICSGSDPLPRKGEGEGGDGGFPNSLLAYSLDRSKPSGGRPTMIEARGMGGSRNGRRSA